MYGLFVCRGIFENPRAVLARGLIGRLIMEGGSCVNKIRLPAMPQAPAPPAKEPDPPPEFDHDKPDDSVDGSHQSSSARWSWENYDKKSDARGSYENDKSSYYEKGDFDKSSYGNGWGNYDKLGSFKGSFGTGSHEKGNFYNNSGFGKGYTNNNDFDHSGDFGKDDPTRQAWENGWEKGHAKGVEKGFYKGMGRGLAKGEAWGFGKGRSEGIAQGRKEAIDELGTYVWVKVPKHYLNCGFQREE